jgi:uncharacterized protein (DUF58 family)
LKINTGRSNKGFIFSLGYPVLFHWLALCVVLVLVLVSAFHHILSLLVIAIFLLLLALVSWFWSRQSLREVSFRLRLNQTRAFPGENIDLTLEIINEKRFPLPWLEIVEELPYRLAMGGGKTPSPYAKERLHWTTSISGRQRLSWGHRLECKARGDYRLGPVRLRSGDIFGLFPKEMVLPCYEPLLVYPQIVPVDRLNLPLAELIGEWNATKRIYEDVSRTVGTRDYRYDDPFKHIHWKTSARHSQLQTRQFESTTSLSLLLVLDVYSFCQQEQHDEEAFELAVTIAASLSYEACRGKSSVGLIANSMPEIQIPVSAGSSQILRLLEALARIELKSRLPLYDQLDKGKNNLPLGTTMVIIVHIPPPSLKGTVERIRQQGHSLLIVSVGNQILEPNFYGVPAICIQSLGDLCRNYWEATS